MFENRVLKKKFGPKRDEITGEWKILHNEELYTICTAHQILCGGSNGRWEGHVACMGERSGVYRVLVVRHEGNIDHLEDLGVDRRIILKWIFKKLDGGLDWIDLAQGRDRWWAPVNPVMELRVA